ncbi:P-loop containing nucleoside triphosphate hydrolase protein [Abortiporus biennis]|nr:P-loop containing nucleoside triphosphate hydrolase protein [Abortiporus biennis]
MYLPQAAVRFTMKSSFNRIGWVTLSQPYMKDSCIVYGWKTLRERIFQCSSRSTYSLGIHLVSIQRCDYRGYPSSIIFRQLFSMPRAATISTSQTPSSNRTSTEYKRGSYAHQASNDVVIAVMGATGTGKSTFINLVSGANFATGNGLISCTDQVSYSKPFEVAGRRVVLIDTPGFDDSTLSDTDVLKMVALHLSMTYEQGFKLNGLIYMHRITDFKMGGISRRNFNMFRKLCGDDTLQNVLIVTTMWGLVDKEMGEARERELMSDERLMKPVIDKGARMVRHDNDVQTARNIMFMMLNNRPMALQIQKEIIDEKKDISETAAGVELDRELAALAKKHRDELVSIQKDMEQALKEKDEETRKELEACRKEVQSNMDNINKDRERLSKEFAQEKDRAEKRMQEVRKELTAEKKAREEREKALEKMEAEYRENSRLNVQERELMRQEIQRLRNTPRRRGFLETLVGVATTLIFLL